MLDTHRLRIFRAVVASGSVNAAAMHLGYTPSAISQQIGSLQRETGLTLFEKSGRGIAPTPAARRLVAASEELMGSMARLDGVVADLRSGRSHSLSIGCFGSAGEWWLPGITKRLRREMPDVLVTISLTEYGEIAGVAPPDLDIRTQAPHAPSAPAAGYHRHELLSEPYFVILPRDHELAGEGDLPLHALADELWVDDDVSESPCGQIMRRAWRAAGFTPRFAARTADHHATLALVASGVGVAMMPQLAIGRPGPRVCVRRVIEPETERGVVVDVREGAAAMPATVRALELLEELAERHTDAA